MNTASSKTSASPAAGPFATLHWTLLLVSLPFGILNFVLPIYGKRVGASAVEIGLLFSVFSFMTVLMRPLVGAGLDRYGRRWFFIAGLAVYGLSMLGFAYASAVLGLVIARILQGTASALLWLAATAIVADLAQADRRGSAFGGIAQSSNQGGILGTFAGFSILIPAGITEGSWQMLFIAYAAAGLLAALIAWRRMPETIPGAVVKEKGSALEGLRAVKQSRTLVVLMVIGIITGASWAMTSPLLMLFLQEKFHAGVETLAWAFLPSALVWAVLPTRLGKLSDRFGRKPLIIAATAIAAVNSVAIAMVGSLPVLAVLWVIEAVCFAASDPASQALIADLTGEDEHSRVRGRVFGAFALTGGLGATLGPLAGGWLYDAVGQAAPFIANGAVLLVCAAAMIRFLDAKR